jgi:hypothetical protein
MRRRVQTDEAHLAGGEGADELAKPEGGPERGAVVKGLFELVHNGFLSAAVDRQPVEVLLSWLSISAYRWPPAGPRRESERCAQSKLIFNTMQAEVVRFQGVAILKAA